MTSRSLAVLSFSAVLAMAGCSNPSRPLAPANGNRTAARSVPLTAPGGRTETRDVFVLLSGGGTPLSNHYSQYVQARAITAWFGRTCPPDSTWVFFGCGNRPGVPAVLSDVRRDSTRDGLVVSSWLPGVLPNNRPATRDSFLRALRDEILPAVRGGGTLFLFVGDHGELAGSGEERESAITLWQLKKSRRRASGWVTDAKEVLRVSELRRILAEGLGAGRVVFCMTQCHGGGFHELGVTRKVEPPPEWFAPARPPTGRSPAGLGLRVAGYTATDEASPAAGCDPDPNPERWAGYERFMPESFLGLDLLSGQRKGRAVDSLAEAHVAATLVDHTIDKPRSTSDHYLAAWAEMIETQLATTLQLTPLVAKALAAYHRTVDSGKLSHGSDGLREREAQFRRFASALGEQLPEAARLIAQGNRRELEAALAAPERSGRPGRRGAMAELRRAWVDVLRPAWKAAVAGGGVTELQGPALELEKRLLALEDDGANLLLTRGGENTRLLNEVYWASGYGQPATLNPRRGELLARWGASRRRQIVEWGRNSADPAVRAAAEKIGPGPAAASGGAERRLTRDTAVARILFYRRVLAAGEFLETMNAETAMDEWRLLVELEQTPLPHAVNVAAAPLR